MSLPKTYLVFGEQIQVLPDEESHGLGTQGTIMKKIRNFSDDFLG